MGDGSNFFRRPYAANEALMFQKSDEQNDNCNDSRLTAMTTYFRVQWGISWDGEWSDFHRSKEVWFWEVI